jgi:hypothetical protein
LRRKICRLAAEGAAMTGVSAILGLDTQADRRRGDRQPVRIEAKIASDDLWCMVDCTILDRSEHGAKIRTILDVILPARFDLIIPCEGIAIAVRNVWRRGHHTGLEFLSPPRKTG